MSPDTIFAAQMWSWPDAVIKRNAQGQVLLVNAAFLAMYGGTVEAWSGNMVGGWSNPPAPGTAVRFETRLPAPAQTDAMPAGELVFDWIESAALDGTSLAIARNITHVQPQPGQTEPHIDMTAAPAADTAPPLAHVPAQAESVFEPVMQDLADDVIAPALSVEQAPTLEAPRLDEPAVDVSQLEAEAPVPMDQPVEPPVEPPVAKESAAELAMPPAPIFETHPEDAIAEVQPEIGSTAPAPTATDVEVAQPVAEAPQVEASEEVASEDREFERRALPIENGSAVLGNNWRDAVIAKAVGATGAEAPVMDTTEDATPHSAPAISHESGTIRILLAEDNAINALLTRTLLEAEGCVVDTVEDGALAVEAMKVKTYDLIFMDMRMPNMDGLESTRKIRQMDHRSKGLPIIALTANAFDDDRNACFDAGMNDFMTKPVSAEELSEMVAAWTGEAAKEKLARMA